MPYNIDVVPPDRYVLLFLFFFFFTFPGPFCPPSLLVQHKNSLHCAKKDSKNLHTVIGTGSGRIEITEQKASLQLKFLNSEYACHLPLLLYFRCLHTRLFSRISYRNISRSFFLCIVIIIIIVHTQWLYANQISYDHSCIVNVKIYYLSSCESIFACSIHSFECCTVSFFLCFVYTQIHDQDEIRTVDVPISLFLRFI